MELPQQVPGPVEPERVQHMVQRAWEPTSPAHHPSTWCPLWLRVVQQMAKLNQHPLAYHPVDAHDDFQRYDSSF